MPDCSVMEAEQRIKELRTMFLQLAETVVEELKAGDSVQPSETFEVMKKIQSELEELERRKGINL